MKDLIAKLQIDANCALGAIWMHIDAQAARIAELEAQIAAASAPVAEQQPVAWSYECQQNAEGTVWSEFINRTKPKLTERDGVRNIKPLYAAPQTADTDKLREAIRDVEISTSGSKGYAKAWNEGAEHMRDAILNLIEVTALQAPVREVPGWKPIGTAPKDGTRILIFGTLNTMLYPTNVVVVGYFERGGWWTSGATLSHATHWMPLPAAPVQPNTDKEQA